MPRLAAIALLYLDQEDAFWSLIAIVEVFMPRDYYTKTLLGSQVSEQKPRIRVELKRYIKSIKKNDLQTLVLMLCFTHSCVKHMCQDH